MLSEFIDLVTRRASCSEPRLLVGVLGEKRPVDDTTPSVEPIGCSWLSREVREVASLGTSSVCLCLSPSGRPGVLDPCVLDVCEPGGWNAGGDEARWTFFSGALSLPSGPALLVGWAGEELSLTIDRVEFGAIGEILVLDLCGVLFTASSALGDAIADHAVVVLTGAVGLPLATAWWKYPSSAAPSLGTASLTDSPDFFPSSN